MWLAVASCGHEGNGCSGYEYNVLIADQGDFMVILALEVKVYVNGSWWGPRE